MSVSPTAGIAAAWSAAKVTPADQASRPLPDNDKASPPAEAPEPKKGPPPAEGQGTHVDIRV
jgi:hypothetical protein